MDEGIGVATAALEACLALPVDRSLGTTVSEDLLRLGFAKHLADVLELKLLAVHDAEDLAPRDGMPSTAVWHALQSGRSVGAVRAEVTLARRLWGGDLGATGARLEQAFVSLDQARAIHLATRRLLTSDVAQLEPILLEAARHVGPDQLRGLGREALRRIEDESTKQQRFEREQASRAFRVSRLGDQALVHGALTDRCAQRWDTLVKAHGGPVPGPDGQRDERTADQREHDLFEQVLEVAAAALVDGADEAKADATLVNIVVDVEDLHRINHPQTPADRQLRSRCTGAQLTWTLIQRPQPDGGAPDQGVVAGAAPESAPLSTVGRDGPARSRHRPRAPEGLPLTAHQRQTLRRGLERIAPALGGIPLDVLNQGRRKRCATPAQHRALALRDRGCVGPGCPCPPGWTQAHHYEQDWVLGGLTDLDDLAKLCVFHHHLVHDRGWVLSRADDGTWSLTPPAAEQAACSR